MPGREEVILLEVLIVITVNFIVYWRSLSYAYVCDDIPVSQKIPPKVNWFIRIWSQVIGEYYYTSKEAHAVTLAAHTIVCALVYLAFGANRFSFICALLFAVNPANHQVAIWISGRVYALSSIMGLLMWLAPQAAPLFFLPVFLYGFPGLYLFPLIFSTTKYWYWAFLVLMIFVDRRKVLAGKLVNKGLSAEMIQIHPRKLILFVKTFGYYFRLGLIARPLCLYHNLLHGYGLNKAYNRQAYALDRDFWIGIFVLYFVSTNIIFNYEHSFGLLWFSICIAQWCNLVTVSQYVAERYLYFANIGLMYTVAKGIVYCPQPYQNYLFIGVLVYYITRLWYYMPAYKNDFWHIEFNLIEQWDNLRARFARAYHKFKLKEYRGAYFDYMVVYQIYPHDFKLNYNIANMLLAQGLIDEAEKYINLSGQNLYQNDEKPLAEKLIADTRAVIADARTQGSVVINKVQILQ